MLSQAPVYQSASSLGLVSKPSDAVIWAREVNGPWSLKNRGVQHKNHSSDRTLHYFGLPLYGRYIRILVKKGDAPVEISNLKIFAAAPSSGKNTLSQ